MQRAAKVLLCLTLLASVYASLAEVGYAADRYTTRRGDTLWEIAERYVQDGTVTTQQMVLALFDANPDAFINGNINRLKIGYTLRIPTRGERRATPGPLETRSEHSAAASTESPGEETAAEDADETLAAVAQDMVRLRNELALTQEQATRQHAENEVLRARVAALETRLIQQQRARELASAQDAAGSGDTGIARLQPPSRMATWFTALNMTIIISGILILGLVATWFWARHATANRAAAETAVKMPPQPHTEEEALPELMIDLDDLELEPVQSGEAVSVPNAPSISPKVDAASPSNAC